MNIFRKTLKKKITGCKISQCHIDAWLIDPQFSMRLIHICYLNHYLFSTCFILLMRKFTINIYLNQIEHLLWINI